jgi:hypothetical protein
MVSVTSKNTLFILKAFGYGVVPGQANRQTATALEWQPAKFQLLL